MDAEAARREIRGDHPRNLLGAGILGLGLDQHDAGRGRAHAGAPTDASPSRAGGAFSAVARTRRSAAPKERPASAMTKPKASGANSASSWKRPLTRMTAI